MGSKAADGVLRRGRKTRRDANLTRIYDRHGTYEEVARRTKLDRRTVKAYLERAAGGE
ncbi:MAG TPA: hypothetical protein VMP11_11040 [Verrucomicrobiae bacterium]|nr:hypothetical protein [Verrucomicrobiae bacterium]